MTATGSQEGSMKVWAITFKELGHGEEILVERDEAGQFVPLLFADKAYGQAVDAFNQAKDDRLSFHQVRVVGEFKADAHAHLVADDGDDLVALRPYDVIGG